MWILSCIFLLSLTMSGFMLPTPVNNIPVPHLKLLKTFDIGFTIFWDPINSTNVTDPIIGIKVKTWKTPCITKSYHSFSINGSLSRVVESVAESYNSTTIPDILPEYVIIVKPDELSATVPQIERLQWYHIRALAFTATAEGKPSNAYDFQLGSRTEHDRKKSCERIISRTPCKENYISISSLSPDSC